MEKRKEIVNGNQEGFAPRSSKAIADGISSGRDFSRVMVALMADIVEGNIPPNVANSVCYAGAKLLKVTDMKFRYASQLGGQDINF